jgi:hypothetical protein
MLTNQNKRGAKELKKLKDLVEIQANNMDCVILRVKDDARLDMISLGYFDGNEEFLRITKGGNHTATVIYKDGGSSSWQWGTSTTMVSDATKKMQCLIVECVVEDFGIYIGGVKREVEATLNIAKLGDAKGRKETMKLTWWEHERDTRINAHLNGEFFKSFTGYANAKKYIAERYEGVIKTDSYVASTGCLVETYGVTRKG